MEKLVQQLEDLFNKIQEGNYLIGQENRDEFYRLTGLLKQQPSEIDQLIENIQHAIDNEMQAFEDLHGHDRNPEIGYYLSVIDTIKKHRT